jgi:hypothetical protein
MNVPNYSDTVYGSPTFPARRTFASEVSQDVSAFTLLDGETRISIADDILVSVSGSIAFSGGLYDLSFSAPNAAAWQSKSFGIGIPAPSFLFRPHIKIGAGNSSGRPFDLMTTRLANAGGRGIPFVGHIEFGEIQLALWEYYPALSSFFPAKQEVTTMFLRLQSSGWIWTLDRFSTQPNTRSGTVTAVIRVPGQSDPLTIVAAPL